MTETVPEPTFFENAIFDYILETYVNSAPFRLQLVHMLSPFCFALIFIFVTPYFIATPPNKQTNPQTHKPTNRQIQKPSPAECAFAL